VDNGGSGERKNSCENRRNILLEAAKSLFLILSALFPIVDPLGGSPIFLAMTREYSPSTRRALSLRIAMNSFFLLVGSYFIGTHILSFFGISLPVVQVGGGLIVISTGWALLKQGNDDDQKGVKKKIPPKDPFRNAFYPLTLPLTVGPGSISVAITLGANAPAPSRVECLERFARNCWVCSPRGEHFSLLRICRPVGTSAWRDRYDRNHATYIVPARLHRRADSMERGQRAFDLAFVAHPLSEGKSQKNIARGFDGETSMCAAKFDIRRADNLDSVARIRDAQCECRTALSA
jgi:MarC family membrane protein